MAVPSVLEAKFLCCLLTYGCLLRPHREIRLLTWGDFDEQLTRISLSGSRNKSGRNRIVPIPDYVVVHLPPSGTQYLSIPKHLQRGGKALQR